MSENHVTPELFAALNELGDSLQKHFYGPVQPCEDEGQLRMSLALLDIAVFLRAIDPNGDEIAQKFATLAGALFELSSGNTHPLFEPKNRAGRRNDPAEIWSGRAEIALAVECLGKAGKTEGQICTIIAKHERGLSRLLRPGSKLKTAVLNWHRQISAGEIQSPGAIGSWRAGMAHIDLAAPKTPEQWRELSDLFIAAAKST